MKRTVLLYGIALAAAAFALTWLEYQYALRLIPPEVYITVIAVAFTLVGVWVGRQLTGGAATQAFERNDQALDYLGISARECEVLALLAEGHSTRAIGERLFVSPNTVKTHLARLYEKLDVGNRTQAVGKAKSLRLVP